MTADKLFQVMDWIYDKAIHGAPGLDSASEMANNYGSRGGTLLDQVNSLIRWQNTKAGTSGFLTGLGGLIMMPVTLPLNVTSVIYVQIRMIAAIAHMGGHDLKDDRVKTLVYVCLTGNAAADIFKEIGVKVGKKFAENAIKNISGKTMIAINQKVGFRLVTKFGERGVVNLGKAIPVLGGILSGAIDSTITNTVGNIARDTFIIAPKNEADSSME